MDKLSYAHAGDLLTVDFEPNKIYMAPLTGRVYHPAPEKYGGIGLIRSKLAIEFSKYLEFDTAHGDNDQEPIKFTWNNESYTLDREWIKCIKVKRFL